MQVKRLLQLGACALVAAMLVGCSGSDAPTEVSDQLAEMRKQTPANEPIVPPEQAQAGFQMMGGGKKGGK